MKLVVWHLGGGSHVILHFGLGQSKGALQFHLHCGCSHTFLQFCDLGHCNLHWGSLHLVWQGRQLPEPQTDFGHIIEQ